MKDFSPLASDSASFRKLNAHLFAPKFAPANPSKGEIQEWDLHDEYEAWLKSQGWFYVHARMDKPSTIQVGHPDFSVFMPHERCCFIEFKQPGKKTTTEQNAKIAHARKFGFAAHVCDNVEEAKRLTTEAANAPK